VGLEASPFLWMGVEVVRPSAVVRLSAVVHRHYLEEVAAVAESEQRCQRSVAAQDRAGSLLAALQAAVQKVEEVEVNRQRLTRGLERQEQGRERNSWLET